jgi:hypothetical protein
MPERWPLRLAREEDAPALEELIALSVHTLLAPHYPPAVLARYDAPLPGDLTLPVVRMTKPLPAP